LFLTLKFRKLDVFGFFVLINFRVKILVLRNAVRWSPKNGVIILNGVDFFWVFCKNRKNGFYSVFGSIMITRCKPNTIHVTTIISIFFLQKKKYLKKWKRKEKKVEKIFSLNWTRPKLNPIFFFFCAFFLSKYAQNWFMT